MSGSPVPYDATVIGAGPAGYVCAIRAAQLGMKVVVVEREWLGGVCLNVGCIPSKALLRNAEVVDLVTRRSGEFGVSVEGVRADFGAAVRRSRQVSERLTKGVEHLLEKNGVDVVRGSAQLQRPGEVDVSRLGDADVVRLSSRHVVIATGARPMVPPGIEVDDTRVLTYRAAILQERRPESVVIVGASAIGVEFATIWAAYGTRVVLVEMMPRIVPAEDADVSRVLSRELAKRGIVAKTGRRVQRIEHLSDGVRVYLDDASLHEVEQVLVATGIRPNTEGLGLEAAGVALDGRGFVAIDDHMGTSVPSVWAIGDVTGKLALAHVGSAQGLRCAEAMAGHVVAPLDYGAMPRATYSAPQIASMGETEEQAVARLGRDAVRSARFDFRNNGKALGMGETAGFVKLVADARSGELLGAHLVGPEVTELLAELGLMRTQELTAEQLLANVHAHPTLSEVVAEAAHGLLGSYLHQ